MLGLFSLLDSILHRPLESLLDELSLPRDSRDALMGKSTVGVTASILALTCACEAVSWEAISKSATALGLSTDEVAPLFAEALRWSDRLLADLQ